MYKVKIFSTNNYEVLETRINEWLEENKEKHIISINFSQSEDKTNLHFSTLIFYEEYRIVKGSGSGSGGTTCEK